jgi:two-component system cell cycle sensor histidine kinase/response regulator CckA
VKKGSKTCDFVFSPMPHPVSLTSNATNMFLRLVGEDVAVEFRPTSAPVNIKADPGRMEQVLMNLVVNARDAMPTGGKIIIETREAKLDDYYVSQHPGSHPGQHVAPADFTATY